MKNAVLIFMLLFVMDSCEGDKWRDVHYTQEEIKEIFNIGECPAGVYFWDEFPAWEAYYDLSEEESVMLGEWTGLKQQDMCNYNCGFFPNKLFIIEPYAGLYENLNDRDTLLNKGIGIWGIRDNKVFARIYSFLTERRGGREKKVIAIEPYEIELIGMKYIDKETGYSKKPFESFKLPVELKNEFRIVPGEIQVEGLRVRILYSFLFTIDAIDPPKGYGYFKIVPDMARAGLSGPDIVQSPELIKKYIWDLWP